jgi:plastocyanin
MQHSIQNTTVLRSAKNCRDRVVAAITLATLVAVGRAAATLFIGFLLALCPRPADGATTTVMVGDGGFFFVPSSVTIGVGDTVQWTWSASGHSSTAGTPDQPSGVWDSGVLNQGATFSHTFPAAGSFPYFCTPHGACCGMIGSVTVSAPTPTPTPTPTPSQLANNSTLAMVGNGDSISIEEFVIQGNQPKKVIVRGIGPSLAALGVPDSFADPVLSLYASNGTLVATNDNWKDTQQAEIEATGIAPTNDLESAIVATLDPGTYATALIGKNNLVGRGLNEIYDLEPWNSVITAIGARDNALTGDDVVTSGFVLIGNQPQSFLLRALGPSLVGSGVPAALADPQLELHDGNGTIIATNDNWKDTQETEIIATGIPPTNDLESAILGTFYPGAYTIIVSGKNGGTGVTFAEIYTLPYSGGPMNPAPVPIPSPTPTPTPEPTGDPTPTPTPTPTPSPVAKSLNISTRAKVESGEDVMIGGFIITGDAPKKVIVRAIGPSLAPLGVNGAVADPVLELHGPDGSLIASDDNWKDNPDQALLIQASGISPQNDLESAIVATINPAGYTAIVSGKNGTSGVALVEVYDLDQNGDSQLANISTRSFVQTGDDVAIGGFILGGADNGPDVIIRAIGPSLSNLGVSNALSDPTLELRDGNGMLIAFDDNWQDDPAQAAQIAAAGFAPQNALEPAIAITLSPGPYTAIIAGKNGTTGVGLVEIYNLQ